MKRLRTFLVIVRTRGLSAALRRTADYLKWRFRKDRAIDKRRLRLSTQIDALLNSTVAYGPFKGLKMSSHSWWGGFDRASMLLGLYEREVLESLTEVPETHNTFIELGAADGYYGIGVLMNGLFDHSYCFEASEAGQKTIRKTAAINGVQDKVAVYGLADRDFHTLLPAERLSQSVLLIDIEGGEFDLCDQELFHVFREAIILIEIHDGVQDGPVKVRQLRDAAAHYFDISEFTTAGRDLSTLSELKHFSDTDRWLICSEGRDRLMTWLRLDPKRHSNRRATDDPATS